MRNMFSTSVRALTFVTCLSLGTMMAATAPANATGCANDKGGELGLAAYILYHGLAHKQGGHTSTLYGRYLMPNYSPWIISGNWKIRSVNGFHWTTGWHAHQKMGTDEAIIFTRFRLITPENIDELEDWEYYGY